MICPIPEETRYKVVTVGPCVDILQVSIAIPSMTPVSKNNLFF